MAPTSNKPNYRDEIAQEIIKRIEAGTAPWQKPWKAGAIGAAPFNPISGNPYHGINDVWLTLQGRADPRWLTYNQALAQEAQVRRGEKSTTIEYWQWTAKEPMVDGEGKPVLDAEGKQRSRELPLDRPRVFFAKVFNAEQIEGLEKWVPPAPSFNPIERAEAIMAGAGVPVFHDQHDRAFYSPSKNSIHLPPMAAFLNQVSYYDTALHELGHATGHSTRLVRQFGPFGSEGYAREELRAEIASYMLSRDLGISFDPTNHAAYVESWLRVLNEDKHEIFRAAKDAETIKTWVMEPERRQELELAARQRAAAQVRDGVEAREQAVRSVAGEPPAPPARSNSMEPAMEERSYISVPYAEKNAAKLAGAKWDGKSWYIPAGADPAAFSKWTAKPEVAPEKQAAGVAQEQAGYPKTIEYSGWRDLGNGYSLRYSVTHPRLGVRTPDGNVLIRGFQETDGKPYQEYEFTTADPMARGSMAWVDKSLADLNAIGATAVIDQTLADLAAKHLPKIQTLKPTSEISASPPPAPEQSPARTYLAVPFSDKEEAKKLGAHWGKKEKAWYIKPDQDPAIFAKWEVKSHTPATTLSPQEEFGEFLKANGLKLDSAPEMDGKWHRVMTEKGGKEKNGSYRGFLDGRPAGQCINGWNGNTVKWVSTGVALTEEERARVQAEAAQIREQREADRLAAIDKAAKTAYGVWQNLPTSPAENSPYLTRKGVGAHGVKIDGEGKVVVPARDADGKLWSVQFIGADGKLWLKDSRKAGTMHVIEPTGKGTLDALDRQAGPIIIAEGYATGARIFESTRRPVVIGFDVGNLQAVAEAINTRFPNRPILIAADNDHARRNAEGILENIGVIKAEETAKSVGGHFIAPKFTDAEKAKGLTDFDDLGKERGNGAVRQSIEGALSRFLEPQRSIA